MTIWICFIILITIFDWLASLSPFQTTKILKNPHKLENSSQAGLQDCATCATLLLHADQHETDNADAQNHDAHDEAGCRC